jgi:hypothetical protein
MSAHRHRLLVRYFDPFADIERHANLLPHWQQPGATYFITFRLADSVPDTILREWEAERSMWLLHHPRPWSVDDEDEYHRRFSAQMDRWLDAGRGACWLCSKENRGPLVATLNYSDRELYVLHAWVIMPNHVHLLVSLHADAKLEDVVGAWKSISARNINRLLNRTGTLWQEDYFDRLVRSEEHFFNCVRYIRRNPGRARLSLVEYDLHESEWVRED